MATLQLKPLLDEVRNEDSFSNTHGRRLTYCGIVIILVTMFLAGFMAWRLNDGCPMYQRAVRTLIAFANGWLYILYVVVGVLLDSFGVGCSGRLTKDGLVNVFKLN